MISEKDVIIECLIYGDLYANKFSFLPHRIYEMYLGDDVPELDILKDYQEFLTSRYHFYNSFTLTELKKVQKLYANEYKELAGVYLNGN